MGDVSPPVGSRMCVSESIHAALVLVYLTRLSTRLKSIYNDTRYHKVRESHRNRDVFGYRDDPILGR